MSILFPSCLFPRYWPKFYQPCKKGFLFWYDVVEKNIKKAIFNALDKLLTKEYTVCCLSCCKCVNDEPVMPLLQLCAAGRVKSNKVNFFS